MDKEAGLEAINPQDWKGVPEEERPYFRALYYHYCVKCGKPLSPGRGSTYCQECQKKENQKYRPERERARANRHNKYCRQKYKQEKDAG